MWNGEDSDADKLIEHITRPVLAQHIPNDERLDAAINQITTELWRFIENSKPTKKGKD